MLLLFLFDVPPLFISLSRYVSYRETAIVMIAYRIIDNLFAFGVIFSDVPSL